jgi:cell division protein FtsQ
MTEALAQPADVRFMNLLTQMLCAVLALLLLWALLNWLARLPQFAVGAITVRGDVAHNNALTLRANIVPRLSGNFFTLDLERARTLFEAMPWVRGASVQRRFPNRLLVTLQEHQAVAFWGAADESRLVNQQGEVFEANPGEAESEDLPRLAGPEGQSAQVLAMFLALKDLFVPIEADLAQLELSVGGSWRAQLDRGATIELGRGEIHDIAARVRRFVGTLAQVGARHGRRPGALEAADLRYEQGYALRLRGVTTSTEAPKDARKATAARPPTPQRQ